MNLGQTYFAVDLTKSRDAAIVQGICTQLTVNAAGRITAVLVVKGESHVRMARAAACFDNHADAVAFWQKYHQQHLRIKEITACADKEIGEIRDMIFGKPEFPTLADDYVAPKSDEPVDAEESAAAPAK